MFIYNNNMVIVFNLQNCLIQTLELCAFKLCENPNYDILLRIEESFPSNITGDYHRF